MKDGDVSVSLHGAADDADAYVAKVEAFEKAEKDRLAAALNPPAEQDLGECMQTHVMVVCVRYQANGGGGALHLAQRVIKIGVTVCETCDESAVGWLTQWKCGKMHVVQVCQMRKG